MELPLNAGTHHASISVSTSMLNPRLAIAVVCIDTTTLNHHEMAIFRQSKQLALATIAEMIGVVPLLIEPGISMGYYERRQRQRMERKDANR